ncbi:MAG: cyclic nucleotide-binding domain-containing protein [Chloroflexi bacterium]|nr:cyclic nucleotide-binding domain-containing protein [Chloroflexota bacterium]
MYQKILIPLDGSKEAEDVFPLVKGEVAEDGEVILAQIVAPARTQKIGEHIILASQQEETDRAEAMGYLRSLVRQQDSDRDNWRLQVEIASSVADGILYLAERESVDLIAMYTHDRKLLARHIKRSIAREVQRRAATEVRIFGTRELEERVAEPVAAASGQEGDNRIFRQIDAFGDLTPEQIDRVVGLGSRREVSEGEMLGTGGELGEFMFVILDGEAHLTTHSEIGEISVRIARPGEAFPLAALLGSGTLITSGEALSDMEVLAIPRSELLMLCTREPEIGMRIYAAVGRLFSNRYAETLTHLTMSAERELRRGDS